MTNGVDLRRFHPGPVDPVIEASLPKGPRVVFVGRLHPQKHLDTLLDAWPVVAGKTDANLVLVGSGPDRDRLIEKARTLGVGHRVHFAGPADDPSDLLRAADVFALPSVAEGMSNSLLEAMATALPCLASTIGGNTDLIEHGRNGMLVPTDTPGAWPEALIRVLSDREFARGLGLAARSHVEANYALSVVVDRYEALYRRLLAEAGR